MKHNIDKNEFWAEERKLCIGTAGNTLSRCLFVMRDKGYQLSHYSVETKKDDGKFVYHDTYEAKKDRRFFSAESPEELLGLIAMWEHRGDGWQAHTDEERNFFYQFKEEAKIYDENENEVTSK